MAVEVYWQNEKKTIIRQNYFGRVSMEDLHQAIAMTRIMLNDVDYEVDVIINIARGAIPPARMVSAAYVAEAKLPKNRRLVVIVNPTPMVKALVKLSRSTAPGVTANMYFADDMFEARGLIAYYNSLI
mgnify:CR=1 FL=1